MIDYQTFLSGLLARHDCQIGTLHLLDPGAGVLRLVAHRGLPPQVSSVVEIVPVGKGMAGLAAERRKPVQTCNLQTDTTGDIRPGARAVPVQGSIAVPMMVGGTLRGVIGFAKSSYHEWSDVEVDALLAAASQAAVALEQGQDPSCAGT